MPRVQLQPDQAVLARRSPCERAVHAGGGETRQVPPQASEEAARRPSPKTPLHSTRTPTVPVGLRWRWCPRAGWMVPVRSAPTVAPAPSLERIGRRGRGDVDEIGPVGVHPPPVGVAVAPVGGERELAAVRGVGHPGIAAATGWWAGELA